MSSIDDALQMLWPPALGQTLQKWVSRSWSHDDLLMISWWSRDDLVMISWWSRDDLMMISWWSHDDLMMISWWSHDDSWWSPN